MKIEYKIKDIVLNHDELSVLHYYYEAAITAKYIIIPEYNIQDKNLALRLDT